MCVHISVQNAQRENWNRNDLLYEAVSSMTVPEVLDCYFETGICLQGSAFPVLTELVLSTHAGSRWVQVWTHFCHLVAQTVKCLSAMQETQVPYLGWEDPLEKEMAAHSSILAWKIPWMVEPGRLLSMGLQRVGHMSNFTSLPLAVWPWRRVASLWTLVWIL